MAPGLTEGMEARPGGVGEVDRPVIFAEQFAGFPAVCFLFFIAVCFLFFIAMNRCCSLCRFRAD